MPRLPHTIDFDDRAFPELAEIFRGIDLGIAAIVASDPTMRPKPAQKRRQGQGHVSAPGRPRRQASRRAAA
ncbi:hypothetical protein SAMN06295905_2169 [Devosia lucknowensis]|uniref:Uncharacterized protein n=1 Tax=Devosia lucknowensis TaxID=1096929 RepID=A0A1Y6FE46_9HYPH|nr:hypothetical protein [Devosia lucknowensis]SMQ72909.1 hypothetical protein SAMN06295905_2169 [Devosia lucknowensis]